MGRGIVSFIALCAASRVCALAMDAAQAGEPMTLNVDYDVPVYGEKDVAMRVQRNLDLEAKLRAKSSLRATAGHIRDLPFSAFAARNRGRGMASQDTEVTVHVPSPAGTATTLLATARADVALLEQLAQAQDLQEQHLLGEVEKLGSTFGSANGA